MPISMQPSVNQDEFYDMRFCGTRGGSSFVNAVRPKPTGKIGNNAYACPSGFEACSPATSLNNTVCVSKSADKTKVCPITFMKFVEKSDKTYLNDTKYTVHEVDSENVFVTS